MLETAIKPKERIEGIKPKCPTLNKYVRLQ